VLNLGLCPFLGCTPPTHLLPQFVLFVYFECFGLPGSGVSDAG
jgi:hypothetical protein